MAEAKVIPSARYMHAGHDTPRLQYKRGTMITLPARYSLLFALALVIGADAEEWALIDSPVLVCGHAAQIDVSYFDGTMEGPWPHCGTREP